jgi:hypothetical protein
MSEALKGGHLRSERCDRQLTDIFAIQDEIAAAIVSTLQSKSRQNQRHNEGISLICGNRILIPATRGYGL